MTSATSRQIPDCIPSNDVDKHCVIMTRWSGDRREVTILMFQDNGRSLRRRDGVLLLRSPLHQFTEGAEQSGESVGIKSGDLELRLARVGGDRGIARPDSRSPRRAMQKSQF